MLPAHSVDMFYKPNLWLSQGLKAKTAGKIQSWKLLGTTQKSAQLGPQGGSWGRNEGNQEAFLQHRSHVAYYGACSVISVSRESFSELLVCRGRTSLDFRFHTTNFRRAETLLG